MKNYVKPMVVANDGLAEGVYMASGEVWGGDCWTVEAKSVQKWNGSHQIYEVHAKHDTTAEHISGCTIVTLDFSTPIVDASSESGFAVSVNGNTVSITRELLGDAYGSGDEFTYKVWVSAGSEAQTVALPEKVPATISCRREVNVQGKI